MMESKVYGLIETDNGYACDKCRGTAFMQSMHLDYADRADTHYVCQGCQQVVCVSVPRDKDDMMWGNE